MATRAKAKRKSKARGRARAARTTSSRAAAKRATAKRAASRRGTAKRAASTRRRSVTRGRAAPKRRASAKRRTTTKGRTTAKRASAKRRTSARGGAAAKRRVTALPRGRAGIALVNAAKLLRAKVERQGAPGDAIAMLEQDHREVEQLHQKFERARDSATKAEIASQICIALTAHTQIEEEIFYPKARRAIDDQALLDEAAVEHASAKQLIAEIESMTPREKLYDAKVTVLVEYVKHHVKEEETELFPKVRQSGIDLDKLGAKMAERKLELLSKLSGSR